jgi:hypothetical protein
MSGLNVRSSLLLLAIVAVAGGSWWFRSGNSTETHAQSVPVKADGKQVALELSIEDADSGLSLSVKRRVPQGITALEAMRMTVAIETKEFEGLGLFVTRLCGVEPAAGKFWSPAVDGQKSKLGVAKITLDQDTRLSWTTREAKSQ